MDAALESARQSLESGQPKEALQHCKAALKAAKAESKSPYNAFLLIGEAALRINEPGQAELAYRKALEVQPDSVPAWQGLAALAAASGDYSMALESNEKLLDSLPPSDPRRPAAQRSLANAYSATGQQQKAAGVLTDLLASPGLPQEARLELLCRLADAQIKLDEAHAAAEMEARMAALPAETLSGPHQRPTRTPSMTQLDVLVQQAAENEAAAEQQPGSQQPTARTLLEIVTLAPPGHKYSFYQEEWLKRLLLRIFSFPPRSVERQQYRLAALRACRDLVFR